MILDDTYGDGPILNTLSIWFGVRVTLLLSKTRRELRYRHNKLFQDADFNLVYNGHNHYCAASKFTFAQPKIRLQHTSTTFLHCFIRLQFVRRIGTLRASLWKRVVAMTRQMNKRGYLAPERLRDVLLTQTSSSLTQTSNSSSSSSNSLTCRLSWTSTRQGLRGRRRPGRN